MNTNIFNEYLNYKIRIICDYANILSKIIGIDKNKLWHKKKELEDILKWIVKDYIFNLDNNRSSENTIKLFLDNKSLFKYNINKELTSTINYFIHVNRALDIKDYEQEIVLVSVLVNIANELDIATSPYKNNHNNYKTILNNYLAKFNKIPYFILIDDSKKNTSLLLDKIKDNVKKERRIFDNLNSKTSFNKYLKIDKNGKYYLSQYNYSVPGLNKIDSYTNKYIYNEQKIDNKFSLISKDIIIVTLMKLFSVRNIGKVFFLPIKVSLLEDKNNIEELNIIFKDNYLSKYINLLINYNEYNKKIKSVLDEYQIDPYIYCDNTISSNLNTKYINNYLFSSEFVLNNEDLIKELTLSKKNVIVEDFIGIEIDYDLLEKEEEYE